LPLQTTNLETNGPQGTDVWMLDGPMLGADPPTNVSPSLASFVHQQHLAQLSQEAINQYLDFHLNVSTAPQLLAAIQQAFTAGGASGMGVLLALDPSIDVGHAVVAYQISDTGDGAFDILLYNPNVPFTPNEDTFTVVNGSTTRSTDLSQSVIHVAADGSWNATLNTADDPVFAGGISNITVYPWNVIPVQPTVPWAEIAAATLLLFVVAGNASVTQVSDGKGHTLLADGKLNTDSATMLPGVRSMPAFGGLAKTLPTFAGNTSAPLTHTVTGTGSGTYDFRWIGGGGAMTLTGTATAGSADTIVTSVNTISVTPQTTKAISAVIVAKASASGSLPRTATLQSTASSGQAIQFSFDAATDGFTYGHDGASTTYTIELESYDAQGKPVSFKTSAASVNTGDTLTIKPDWTQLAAGVGTVQIRAADGTTTSRTLK
jgi:hypothetical protein